MRFFCVIIYFFEVLRGLILLGFQLLKTSKEALKYFILGCFMKFKFLSKPFLIFSLPLVLTTGCYSFSTTSSEYIGSNYSIKADATDEIGVNFYNRSYCVDMCATNYPEIYSQELGCSTQNNCLLTIQKVTYSNTRPGEILHGKIINYKVEKNEVVKGNSYKEVSFKAISKTVTESKDLLSFSDKKMPDFGPDANEFLSKPYVITVTFDEPVEFISAYNQESVAGNLNRFNLIDTKKVEQVKNAYPIAYNCLNGTVRAEVKTYAYRNGTRAVISNIEISPESSALSGSEFDTRPYKKAIIEKLKKVIRD